MDVQKLQKAKDPRGNSSFLAPTGNSGCQNRHLDAASWRKSEGRNRSTCLKVVGKSLLMASCGPCNSMFTPVERSTKSTIFHLLSFCSCLGSHDILNVLDDFLIYGCAVNQNLQKWLATVVSSTRSLLYGINSAAGGGFQCQFSGHEKLKGSFKHPSCLLENNLPSYFGRIAFQT